MGEVVKLNCWTSLDIPVDRVLEGLKGKDYKRVIILGIDDEDEIQLHSSSSSLSTIHTDLSSCSLKILLGHYGKPSN